MFAGGNQNLKKLFMKKLLSFSVALLFCTSVFAQLPYSKMLALDEAQLKENKFKYDKGKNQYVLNKSNGMNNTMNVLSAIGGTTADIKPHEDDYRITAQFGDGGMAYLNVVFYKDDTFHDVETWLAENNIDVIETNSGKRTIQKFNYDNYQVQLDVERVGITTVTGNTSALAKGVDESYNIYTYTIYTGIEPSSKWHDKQKEKKAQNDAKGKKKDIGDLF